MNDYRKYLHLVYGVDVLSSDTSGDTSANGELNIEEMSHTDGDERELHSTRLILRGEDISYVPKISSLDENEECVKTNHPRRQTNEVTPQSNLTKQIETEQMWQPSSKHAYSSQEIWLPTLSSNFVSRKDCYKDDTALTEEERLLQQRPVPSSTMQLWLPKFENVEDHASSLEPFSNLSPNKEATYISPIVSSSFKHRCRPPSSLANMKIGDSELIRNTLTQSITRVSPKCETGWKSRSSKENSSDKTESHNHKMNSRFHQPSSKSISTETTTETPQKTKNLPIYFKEFTEKAANPEQNVAERHSICRQSIDDTGDVVRHCNNILEGLLPSSPGGVDMLKIDIRMKHRKPGSPMRRSKSQEMLFQESSVVETVKSSEEKLIRRKTTLERSFSPPNVQKTIEHRNVAESETEVEYVRDLAKGTEITELLLKLKSEMNTEKSTQCSLPSDEGTTSLALMIRPTPEILEAAAYQCSVRQLKCVNTGKANTVNFSEDSTAAMYQTTATITRRDAGDSKATTSSDPKATASSYSKATTSSDPKATASSYSGAITSSYSRATASNCSKGTAASYSKATASNCSRTTTASYSTSADYVQEKRRETSSIHQHTCTATSNGRTEISSKNWSHGSSDLLSSCSITNSKSLKIPKQSQSTQQLAETRENSQETETSSGHEFTGTDFEIRRGEESSWQVIEDTPLSSTANDMTSSVDLLQQNKSSLENSYCDSSSSQSARGKRDTIRKETLFDVEKFDMILESIFPSKETSAASDLFRKELLTPTQLLKIQNKPPIISYADKECAIRHTSVLYNQLLSSPQQLSGDVTLPLHIPFLASHQLKYVQNRKGHYIDIGWSGESNVYLALDHTMGKLVAIKVKKKMKAVNEARMLLLLSDLQNIPIFYGGLVMSDERLMGVVCEHITGGTESKDLRSKDIGTFLSLHRSKHADCIRLTQYQWLDMCIAITKIIVDLHHNGILSNDITRNNFLLRFEGKGWVPYIADLSEAERAANSTSVRSSSKTRALMNSHRLWAPEVFAGERRKEATDVFSLAHLISDIYTEIRLPSNPVIEEGLSEVPSSRPTARTLMNAVIYQRSHFDVDKSEY